MCKKLYDFFVFIRNLLIDSISILIFHDKVIPDERELVLVVRIDLIGDFVLWLDSASALRELYPQERYRIVLFGNSIWAEFAAISPFFDETICVDINRLFYNSSYRFNTWKELRTRVWTVAIHPTFSRDCICGDSVIRVSGASDRIGSVGNLSNQLALQRWISNHWYTRLLPVSSDTLMELERNAEFIRNLGGKDFKAGLPELPINVKLPPGFEVRDYVVVVPGASLPVKQWPLESFAELSDRIYRKFAAKVVICGSRSETILAHKLLKLTSAGDGKWIEDWTGRTSLVELASIIKGAKMLIGNDSSAVHIAAAVGIPAICIVGGGHFGRFMPYSIEKESNKYIPIAIFNPLDCYGCNLKCTNIMEGSATGKCISSVTVETVWERVIKLHSMLNSFDKYEPGTVQFYS